jgi:hypothetical protein
LANSVYLQQGDLSGYNAKKLVGKKYTQFSKVINGLFLLDQNNIVTLGFSPAGSEGAFSARKTELNPFWKFICCFFPALSFQKLTY